ncbi:hypothetical protein [Pseudomonas aeruginosa]|uniref:hypothetical protein n=1 Tax=Pseudomonas aeruginosa TaxID=287 RepID=UPI003CE8F337
MSNEDWRELDESYRSALSGALQTARPAVEQACWDERKLSDLGNELHNLSCSIVHENEKLAEQIGGIARELWNWPQARAALAQPSPAPELERPEVAEVAFVLRNIGAMDAEDIDGDNVDLRFEDAEGRDTGCDVSIVEYAEKAADLFEQHDRIVGALRAEIAEWQEAAGRSRSDVVAYIAERAKLLEERAAALVEVERLRESKGDPVGSLEKCMKVMYERDEHAKQLEAALARVAELERELRDEENAHTTTIEQRANAEHWADQLAKAIAERFGVDIGEHSNLNCPWNEALVWMQQPPTQAQHSVPEGWMLVPVEPLLNMMSDKDHDTRITAERQLLSILAAAPGKEGV